MPQFEQGKVKETVQQAVKVTAVLSKYIDEGYDIVAPVASCALMLKKEWPLLMPDNSVGHPHPELKSITNISLAGSKSRQKYIRCFRICR